MPEDALAEAIAFALRHKVSKTTRKFLDERDYRCAAGQIARHIRLAHDVTSKGQEVGPNPLIQGTGGL